MKPGIPEKVGAFPINDPDGYYKGFAASGYGIMWNTRYLKAKKLPVPKTWGDLAKPVYHGHAGMSAPSRSGTTHLTVETLLQGEGWEKGWAKWKRIAGNFKTVTDHHFRDPRSGGGEHHLRQNRRSERWRYPAGRDAAGTL